MITLQDKPDNPVESRVTELVDTVKTLIGRVMPGGQDPQRPEPAGGQPLLRRGVERC